MTRALQCEVCGRFCRIVPTRAEIPVCRDCADGLDYREQLAREDAAERRAEQRRDR